MSSGSLDSDTPPSFPPAKTGGSAGVIIAMVLIGILVLGGLAFVAFTGMRNVSSNAERSRNLSNAKQIALACRVFASENNGIFPEVASGMETPAGTLITGGASTDVWNILMQEGYLQSDFIYYRASSGHPRPNGDQLVSPTENHMSYFHGLTDASSLMLPLVIVSPAEYEPHLKWGSPNTAAPGAAGSGNRVNVVYLDYSGRTIRLQSDGTIDPADDPLAHFPAAGDPKIDLRHPEWLTGDFAEENPGAEYE